MSRGLGPAQRALLELAGRYRGVLVSMLPEFLDVSARRARKVIESCAEAGLVVVVNDPWTRQRRAFTPEAHRKWVHEQRLADERRELSRLWPGMRTARRAGTAR